MRRKRAVRMSNVRRRTETTTKASAKKEAAAGIRIPMVRLDKDIMKAGKAEEIFENYRAKARNARDEITLADLPKAMVSYKGAFPLLADGISELCTRNPTNEDGTPVIKFQDDDTPYLYAVLHRDDLIGLCTNWEEHVLPTFWREVTRLVKTPKLWYINFGNGRGMAGHVFIINVYYEDLSQMSEADAARCRNLGIERRVTHFGIFFLRPLFESCLPGKSKGAGGGFLTSEHAFYTYYTKALLALETEADAESLIFRRLCNPNEATFALTKEGGEELDELIPYYRAALCFLAWAEGKAKFYEQDPWIRKSGEEVIELMKQVYPGLLAVSKGKVYLKDRLGAMCLIDRALWGLNKMARMGYADHLKAIPIRAIYKETGAGLEIELEFWARGKRRANVDCPIYTSRNIEKLAGKNPRNAGQRELF